MAHPHQAPADQSAADLPANVIGLDRPGGQERTRVRIDRDSDRLAGLTDDDRRRLLVRVLCELVALQDPTPVRHAVAS